MPSKCAVADCSRTHGLHKVEDDNETPLHFFAFKSQSDETLMEWIKFCGRNDLTLDNCKKSMICSMHFQTSDILGNRVIRGRIRPGAIPSKNPCKEVSRFISSATQTPPVNEFARKSTKRSKYDAYRLKDDSTRAHSVHPVNVTAVLPNWHYEKTNGITWYFQVLASDNAVPCVKKSVKVHDTGLRVQFYIGTEALPSKMRSTLMEGRHIYSEEQFIEILKQFNELAIKENPLKSVVQKLETFLNDTEEERDMNESGESDPCDFIRFMIEQFNMYSVGRHLRRWTSDVMRWAVTFNFYSPAAYRFVYNSGYILLPNVRTLSKYISSETTTPGSSEEVSSRVSLELELLPEND